MRAPARDVVAVAAVLAAAAGLLWWGFGRLLLGKFTGLEERDTRQDVERAVTALADEIASLGALAADYASWNETYAFMQDRDPRFVAAELPTADHSSIRVQVVALLDTAGALVVGKSLDLDREREGPLPPALERALSAPEVRRLRGGSREVQGILVLPDGPMLVASRPILTNAGEGPPRGTLVLGRWLDAWQVEKLTRYTRFTLRFDRFDDPAAPPDVAWARSRLTSREGILVRARSADSISGYAQIEDLAERPALLLRVDSYRRIHKLGLSAWTDLAASLALLGLIALGAAIVALRRAEASRGPAPRG